MRARKVATDEFRARVAAGASAKVLAHEFEMGESTAARLKAEVLAETDTDEDGTYTITSPSDPEDLAYTISFDVPARKLDVLLIESDANELKAAVLLMDAQDKANILQFLMYRRANSDDSEEE